MNVIINEKIWIGRNDETIVCHFYMEHPVIWNYGDESV